MLTFVKRSDLSAVLLMVFALFAILFSANAKNAFAA